MAQRSVLKMMSLTVPLAGTVALADEADACIGDPCTYADAWRSLAPMNAAAIPIDGVLLLQGEKSGDMADADWLARVDMTVTRDGQPVAGALETSSVDGVLIWRPAAPLEAAAIYTVLGTLDNPEMEPYYDCAPDILDFGFDVFTDAEPAAPLGPPGIGVEESVNLDPLGGLEDLVCCDDAFPYEYAFDCGGSGSYVSWNMGDCAALRGHGTLKVQLTVDHDLPPATAALVTSQLVTDGQPGPVAFQATLSARADQPFCTEIVLRNVATGESVTTPKQCHGDAVAAQLGLQMVDPSAELAQECTGPAYVCTVLDGAWDPQACTPWPPEAETSGATEPTEGPETVGSATESAGTEGAGTESTDTSTQDNLGDRGCSCDGGAPGSFGLLAIAGIGLLRRRRATDP